MNVNPDEHKELHKDDQVFAGVSYLGQKRGEKRVPTNNQKYSKEAKEKRHAWNEIVYKPEDLEQEVNEYLQACLEDGKRATKPGLAVHLGISTSTYDRWIKATDKQHKKHAAILKKAELVMSDRLQQETNASAIFMLKQACYGGLSDRQESEAGGNKITIDILSNGTKIT